MAPLLAASAANVTNLRNVIDITGASRKKNLLALLTVGASLQRYWHSALQWEHSVTEETFLEANRAAYHFSLVHEFLVVFRFPLSSCLAPVPAGGHT